ncbi:MAG: AI-2E family transporter, partial [Clostridia bacterium]|nr:AI-2E family transporter [Clostridia bacterium]
IDGNVIAPRVMGDRLEIRPLTIIVAVSVGGSLFGFVGMLISVPIVAIIRAAFVEYIHAKEGRNEEDEVAQEDGKV